MPRSFDSKFDKEFDSMLSKSEYAPRPSQSRRTRSKSVSTLSSHASKKDEGNIPLDELARMKQSRMRIKVSKRSKSSHSTFDDDDEV